ncbi:MAG: cytochrome c maturation protein CcmE, partial [Anaerolineales bacterium]|nr:cytochrome c maturation protein CcmE [Anaerolineales bacterium]
MSSDDMSDSVDEPGSRAKFMIGGIMIAAAIVYLIAASTKATTQYYMTIDELIARGEAIVDRDIKISGVIIGDTIEYDAQTLTLRFTVAQVPADLDEVQKAGGIMEVQQQAIANPNALRLEIVHIGPRPDLLRHGAQAIITGRLGED